MIEKRNISVRRLRPYMGMSHLERAGLRHARSVKPRNIHRSKISPGRWTTARRRGGGCTRSKATEIVNRSLRVVQDHRRRFSHENCSCDIGRRCCFTHFGRSDGFAVFDVEDEKSSGASTDQYVHRARPGPMRRGQVTIIAIPTATAISSMPSPIAPLFCAAAWEARRRGPFGKRD